MTRDDINRAPTLPFQPIPAGIRQPRHGTADTRPVMPNHPVPAGAPPIERREAGAINSDNPPGGYVQPARFPADTGILSPTARNAYDGRSPFGQTRPGRGA
jgi:hypothetical protein